MSLFKYYSDPSTRKKANEEFKELLKYRADSSIRINLALSLISKALDSSQKGYSKPELIRSLGTLTEVFQEKLIDFVPRIQYISLNCLTEDDLNLHDPLRELFGKLTKYTLSKASKQDGARETKILLKNLWEMCGGTSKYTQIGAALCMSKVLQGIHGEIISDLVERVALKLVDLLRRPECKATLQLLECIMNLLVSIDENAAQLENAGRIVLNSIVENLSNTEWNVRKLALEILYLLTALNREGLEPFKKKLLEIVSECKFDKVK